jgi:hypothetical protein
MAASAILFLYEFMPCIYQILCYTTENNRKGGKGPMIIKIVCTMEKQRRVLVSEKDNGLLLLYSS